MYKLTKDQTRLESLEKFAVDAIKTEMQNFDRINELRNELADMIFQNRKLSTENMKLKFELNKHKNA